MDDVNSQLRKEYEMLRMEFEQNLVANEQTGPINREMRHLITSLQDHNIQLKSDVHRYKRKYKELSAELGKVSKFLCFCTTVDVAYFSFFSSQNFKGTLFLLKQLIFSMLVE